jgi:hypothetical protein
VFDILEMAGRIDAIAPGSVSWEICGAGSYLDELEKMLVEKDCKLSSG